MSANVSDKKYHQLTLQPSLIPIPRLNIPSESVSTTSSVSDDAPPIAVKKDVEDTVAVDEKEAEVETCGFNLQALNAEQTSLSWTCDAFSKESDHMGTGWASQIDDEHFNCVGNRDAKVQKNTTYSPMPTNKSTMAFPSDFIVNSISTKPRDERNFIWQNKKDIRGTRKPKKDSYCHSMKPMMKTFVEFWSSSGRTDLGNQLISTNSQYVNPIVELEQLSHEQRMDLYQANNFEGENLQGKTEQIASQCLQPQKNVHIPLSEPNVPRRPVKIINFKVLNKHYQTETKSQMTNCCPDSFLTQRCKDVRSSRSETICYEAFKTTYDSMEGQPIDPKIQAKKKVLLNKKGFQNNPANADRERRKSKREIMIEYSKTVAAANLVRDKKGILEARQKFPSKHISALDVELARILHTHEAETQRMASPFIT